MNGKQWHAVAMGILLAGGTLAARADDLAAGFSPVLYGGLTFGGDDFVSVEYDGGGDDDIEAGGLVLFGAGLNYRFADAPVDIQLTIGYHADGADADNGDASFTRMPVDLLVFYNAGNHCIGGGITYHLSPELEIDIDYFGKVNDDFDDEAGLVIEYNYKITPNMRVGARYTSIEYTSEFGFDVKGDHAGLMARYVF